MERTLETRSILHMSDRQKAFFSASFRDEAKRIYVLEILETQPETLTVVVKAPAGRSSPIDPLGTWQITFSNHLGAYQTRVTLMEVHENTLQARLHPESKFLARRKSVRLPTDSRNPTQVHFFASGQRREGYLVDFSLEGFGLETASAWGLSIGDLLTQGQCIIKGNQVSFSEARIVQRAYQDDHVRFGLEFQNLTEAEEEGIHEAFHQCFSPHSTISTVLDG